MTCSGGRDDRESKFCGGGRHSLVVRAHPREIGADLDCSGEVDRVERSELQGQECAGRSQDPIVDSDHVKPPKYVIAAGYRVRAEREKGARHFRPREGTCDQGPFAAKVASQRCRIGFSHGQLHERRRIEVGRSALSAHRDGGDRGLGMPLAGSWT